MAKFTWSAGTSADWRTISDWTPTTGAPPGALTANRDQAVFNNTHQGKPTTYTVSIATAETFNLATVSLSTSNGQHGVPAISVGGSLLTSELAYSGSYATPITISPGGLFDIRTTITDEDATPQTITIAADNGGAVGSGGQLEFGLAFREMQSKVPWTVQSQLGCSFTQMNYRPGSSRLAAQIAQALRDHRSTHECAAVKRRYPGCARAEQ